MRIATTRVVDGRIEPPPPEPVALVPEQEQELSDALDAIRSGEYVDGWALLEDLKAKLCRPSQEDLGQFGNAER